MKTTVESRLTEKKSVMQKAAKIAGITFLFNLIVPTLSYVFIQSHLIAGDNLFAIAENLSKNESLFRIGFLFELILSVGLIILGYSLYIILSHLNQYFARFAFVLKVLEATLMAVISLLSFVAFQMLVNSGELFSASDTNIKIITGFLLSQHSLLNSVPMLFLGIEMVVFSILLYKSAFIPKLISAFGIFSFVLIFVFSILSIINPNSNYMLLTLPSFLFELICGIWLLLKGISLKHLKPANQVHYESF